MATHSFSSLISHDTDVDFRAWGLELSDALDLIGFTKSADTGQIDWSTVVKASTDQAAGYEIRFLDDTLHATTPIYVKLEFGTGPFTNRPSIWVTVGTGTNGAGTITGITVSRRLINHSEAELLSTSANYPTYMCKTEGVVWFSWKIGSRNTGGVGGATFAIFRSCDSFGDVTGTSMACYMTPTMDNGGYAYSANVTCYTFDTGYTASIGNTQLFGGGGTGYTFLPYNLSLIQTTVAGVPAAFQVSRHFIITPQVFPINGIVSSTVSDGVSLGSTFDATVIGSTSHTYISLATNLSYYEYACLIWE
jgi:hypothetical protein